MLVNILLIKCMDLAFINLLTMDTATRGLGMKAEGKDLECIHIEMEKPNPVTGRMEFLTFPALRILLIQCPPLQFIIPKYSMQCR